jgi:hypothetical protein
LGGSSTIYRPIGPYIASDHFDRLIAGDVTAAQDIGLDVNLFTHRPPDATDAVEAYLHPVVEKAAFPPSVNEAWILLASIALIGFAAGAVRGQGTATDCECASLISAGYAEISPSILRIRVDGISKQL